MGDGFTKDKFARLRWQAEDSLHDQPASLADLSPADVQALIHNLQVHQIELELQNEELRAAQLELQTARDRYADLYNFAPVGYFTLDVDGAIIETNLTGANLLGVNRSALMRTPFTRFVVKEDRERYAIYRVRLGASERPQTIEIKLVRPDGVEFHAQLEGLAAYDGEGKFKQGKLTISDITQRKRAEQTLHHYTERLRNLRELDLDIVAAQSPEAIVQTTLKRLRHLIPCQRASVTLFDFEAQEALVLTVEVSGETRVPAGLRQPLPTDWMAALQQGQTLVVADTLALAQPLPVVKMLIDDGIRSCINVPLLVGSELLGVVNLGSDLPGAFNAQYIEMAEEATIVLAIALQQARLHEQVSHARERLEVLSHRLLEAQETERRHIARELHDEIGQNLSMVKIDLQTMQQLPQARPLAAQLGESISIVERALHQVRALSVELRPSLLDDLGLIPALRWYTDRQAQRGGFSARFVAAPLQARLTSELETVCYRLVQEALTNVVRHAQARQVEVELQQREAELCLFIRDDGLGFDAAAALKQVMHGTSLGLLSMQERVLLVGGQIELKSVPRQGTVIQARLPLKYAPPTNFD